MTFFAGTMNTVLSAVRETKNEDVNELKQVYASVVSFYIHYLLSAKRVMSIVCYSVSSLTYGKVNTVYCG